MIEEKLVILENICKNKIVQSGIRIRGTIEEKLAIL